MKIVSGNCASVVDHQPYPAADVEGYRKCKIPGCPRKVNMNVRMDKNTAMKKHIASYHLGMTALTCKLCGHTAKEYRTRPMWDHFVKEHPGEEYSVIDHRNDDAYFNTMKKWVLKAFGVCIKKPYGGQQCGKLKVAERIPVAKSKCSNNINFLNISG